MEATKAAMAARSMMKQERKVREGPFIQNETQIGVRTRELNRMERSIDYGL